ncbi:hypothetical protein Tco_0619731 [Tanacetum coccineum]
MDDLYNNLKIYETEVKGSSSPRQNSQNVTFVSSNSSGSTNQAHGFNSANTDSMSDVMAMLTMRARRFINKTGRKISANGSETIWFNKLKSDQAKEGPTNFAFMAYTSSSSSSSNSEARLDVYKKNEAIFEEDINILKLNVMLRDKALTELRKKFEKAKKEIDDLKLTLEKFKNVNDKYKNRGRVSMQFHLAYTGNFMAPKILLGLAD